ncbi:MAG: exodeoxyribonuclease VII small subunit [Lachnospiraceae bacterium]|nr:exodeoxyribonuclease VII small subunit [Lachnospiraceae bacterium]
MKEQKMEACENTQDVSGIPVEQALEQLEELIARLENKECTLEESFHLYKEGIGLVQYCSQALTEVEQQLVILNEEGEINGF